MGLSNSNSYDSGYEEYINTPGITTSNEFKFEKT